MIHLRQAVVVEGKYDKMRLSALVDGPILVTNGFRIFKNREQTALLRRLAQGDGILILTDSDAAGFKIRNYIKSVVPNGKIYHAYIPEILGKEPRKDRPSKEGTLGVEGMERELLRRLFAPYAGSGQASPAGENPLSKLDFYTDGLTGAPDSAARRDAFAARLGLPPGMTPNALLAAVRMLCSYPEYLALVGREEKAP